ncbi:AFADIN [Salix koriyanagi]|uniref:AFADIN n=1 Tax=Salix koriyanagi TaxID=2511006 RepID=A0A9Q0TRM8_9ROSI|nr:AFADIN [Salix koriyanagi]
MLGKPQEISWSSYMRLSSEEQKDHIEVFQISETLKRHKHRSMSVEKRKLISTSPGAKVMFRMEEFKQSTSVSEDMKLQSSNECHDAQEVIDSKADDFPKYLQEPEFTKKANNLQGLITFIKPLCPSHRRDIGRSRKFWSLGEQGYAMKIEDGLGTYSCRTLGLDIAHEFLGTQLDLNDGSCRPTARIVVLKPNPGKARNGQWYILIPSVCTSVLLDSGRSPMVYFDSFYTFLANVLLCCPVLLDHFGH